MPDLPISGLPAATDLDDADLLPIVDTSTATTKKLTGAQLRTFIGGQMFEYTGPDPTTDGIVPDDPTLPAMAYSQDGSGSTYHWNTNTQAWI
jgi:hypothetical protein